MPGPLETLIFGYRIILVGVTEIFQRARLRFDPDQFEVVDDEEHEATFVRVRADIAGATGDPGEPGAPGADGADGAGSPGGLPGQVQYRGDDDDFLGTEYLIADIDTGALTHFGNPVHKESVAHFQQSDDDGGTTLGEAQSRWGTTTTPDDEPAILLSTFISLAVFGDCIFTITYEITVSSTSGGGNICLKAVFRRNAGAIEILHQGSTGDPDDLTIPATVVATVTDDETVAITATPPDYTCNWVVSTHVQIAKEPA